MLHEIDLSRVDLNQLVLFEAVLAEGSVARAGARLRLSPSAVSHGLGRLRRALNDPLFLKHPRGVVPTARASELAAPVADVLARVRAIIASARGFDATTSTRRFTIGAPDGVTTVIMPPLLSALRAEAPGVALSVRALLPQTALAELDAGSVDIAVQPIPAPPPRFVARPLYDEVFVIGMRPGHPLGPRPSVKKYCAASHILVSASGDPVGNVDDDLRALGLSRRVVLTAPDFMTAMTIVARTDLVAALPARQAALYAPSLGVAIGKLPIPSGREPIVAIAPRAAMADAGVAWLYGVLTAAAKVKT
jgi:DNA-binding transcriptional LysR family regulator